MVSEPSFPTAKVVPLSTAGAGDVQPDWVMLGWRRAGKCFLMASETVLQATMRPDRQTHHFRSWEDFLRPGAFKPIATVTATVQQYVVISANTYAECLAALLFGHQWRPDDAASMRAIEEGDPT